MIDFDDYPYSAIRSAMGTTLGRIGLVAGSIVLGSMLAALSATGSVLAMFGGAIATPLLCLSSIIAGYGAPLLPMVMIFAVCFVRWQWPLWTVLVCTVLMWWNFHTTISWGMASERRMKGEVRVNR